ncbi:sigma-54-dependent Fis family transcriptional regulator [bacterium]|nr:sigma-54-dependent Fis family transcriptional regulator [candidate division CSSED10-310 bacterium]
MAYVANVLVVDDDESMRLGCAQALTGSGFKVASVENGDAGLELMRHESFDAVILDLKMPGLPGIQVLRRIKKNHPGAAVIVITAYGTIDKAVEAMRFGAFDFITKPFTPEALVEGVEKAVAAGRHSRELKCVEEAAPVAGADFIIGRSQAMTRVITLIRKVAPTDSTVLIHGETGVGKELVARSVHRLSPRRARAFVTVDCGSLVESLFESELFGHVKGSFTGASETTNGKFEMAAGGTIFLDEIANISLNLQARLLRVVQEREIVKVGSTEKRHIDVRITSATNRNLLEEVHAGHFREDLYYRLNVVPIKLPPLRERREDIPLLVQFFRTQLEKRFSGQLDGRRTGIPEFSPEAMDLLQEYDWPGNVRELKNVIERVIVTIDSLVVGREDLLELGMKAAGGEDEPVRDGTLAQMERDQIERVLAENEGNKTRAAGQLGIDRKTLREKIRKYGIE